MRDLSYRELRDTLNNMSDVELDCTVTYFDQAYEEFFPVVCSKYASDKSMLEWTDGIIDPEVLVLFGPKDDA